MKGALEEARFRVSVTEDGNLARLQQDIKSFLDMVQPGDVCLFYFSGYAMQAQQDNYLLPLDFDPANQQGIDEIPTLTGIQQLLERSKAGLKILVLEASRRNEKLIAQGVGLASPDVGNTNEVIFAFSAAPNQVTSDNPGVFTRKLAAAIRKEGLTLDQLFQQVRDETSNATGGEQKILQQIYVSKGFFFHEPKPVVKPPPEKVITPPPPQPPPPDNQRKAGTVATNRKDREDYVWIPGGSFQMGCVPADTRCKAEEKPQHKVTITQGFWLGRNETTTGSYRRFVEEDKKNRKMPATAPGWDAKWRLDNYPLVEESWEEAKAYCEWAGGRLPTEAEWERAARAGKDDEIYPLNDENSREKANFEGMAGNDRWEQAAPVRSFDQNPFGLFDMAGNVWEWCLDVFSKTYFPASPEKDPQGPAAGADHSVRGGSWFSDPKQHLRLSYRETRKKGNVVGFRCLLPDTPATDALFKPR